MKVLCPVDFSKVSDNAAIWITNLLSDVAGAELHLLHFMNENKKSNLFQSKEVLIERAKRDMSILVENLTALFKLTKPLLVLNEG